MTKADDYRKNAAQTIELASRAEAKADKGHLLALAEKWLDLADRAHRLPKRFSVTHNHPLVDAKLGHAKLGHAKLGQVKFGDERRQPE